MRERTILALVVLLALGSACKDHSSDKSEGTTTTVVTQSTAAGAYANITLTPRVSGSELKLAVEVTGMVPQLYSAEDGNPIKGPEQDLNQRVDFGDGSPPEGTDGGNVTCKPSAPLVPIHISYPGGSAPSTTSQGSNSIQSFDHSYRAHGTYTVTYKVKVCDLGDVTKTTSVVIR